VSKSPFLAKRAIPNQIFFPVACEPTIISLMLWDHDPTGIGVMETCEGH
jgi:hypothetical protein